MNKLYAEDMESLSDTEIDELAEKLTTVPFRKIKKLKNELFTIQ